MHWVVSSQDPKLMVHPMLVLLGDIVWSGIAMRSFMVRKIWFVFTLMIFVLSQSILKGLSEQNMKDDAPVRYALFVCRCFIYLFSMGQMVFLHMSRILGAYRHGRLVKLGRVSLPSYLTNWQEAFNLVLMLCIMSMLCTEPILHCLSTEDIELFSSQCAEHEDFEVYYIFSMIAMCLYYVLLLDLAVFNNRVSAYVLVCGRMISEITLFLLSVFCVLLTLSSAFSCLKQKDPDFQTIPMGIMSLWEMLLKMFSTDHYKALHDEPVVLIGVYCYLVMSVIFLLNLLIAQLCCSYDSIYADMVGYARLKRCRIIVETMPMVSPKRWAAFRDSLSLNERIEFNEGDIGVAGGIQVLEAANVHPTTVDSIKRVGGTTSVNAQWPEEDADAEDDKFGKLETLIKKAMDTFTAAASSRSKKGGVRAGSSGMSGSGMEGGSAGEAEEE